MFSTLGSPDTSNGNLMEMGMVGMGMAIQKA